MRLWRAIRTRIRIWQGILLQGALKKALLIIYGLIASYDLFNSQVIPEKQLPTVNKLIADWDWQIWVIIGLALLLFIALEGIYKLHKKSSSDNWILNYEFENGKLPPIPKCLLPVVQNYEEGQPISREVKLTNMSGQFWHNLSPSHQRQLLQMADWLGIDPDDYLWQMRRMLPKSPQLNIKWTPPEQR